MRVFSTRSVAAVLLAGFVGAACADSGLSRFFGTYSGFGVAEDSTGPFINTERNFALAIRPADAGGFEVSWSTGKRKGNDPNQLAAIIDTQTTQFRPTGKPGLYRGVDAGSPIDGATLAWARLQGDLLVTYQLVLDESGVPEMQIYRRRLTPKGLELLFTASRDGQVTRTVRGRYAPQ
jgi:hypothetical protein